MSAQSRNFLIKSDSRFIENIVTEDETPLSLYIPESKRTSAEWKFPDEKPSKKLRTGSVHRRSRMLSVFWNYKGVINIDFADPQTIINGAYYANLIEQTRKMRRKSKNVNLWLLHDNAPVHTAWVVVKKINSCGFQSSTIHLTAPTSPPVTSSYSVI